MPLSISTLEVPQTSSGHPRVGPQEFGVSRARGTMEGIHCMKSHGHGDLPGWLDKYIKVIGRVPNRFDFAGFNLAMALGVHCRNNRSKGLHLWVHTQPENTRLLGGVDICYPWQFRKGECCWCTELLWTVSPSETFDVPNANLIIRSSDKVKFRAHKAVLAMASPFFKIYYLFPSPSTVNLSTGSN
jgi:hypothetical protein